MKRNLVKAICAFLLLAFVTPAVFAETVEVDHFKGCEKYDVKIKQIVNIPGGKLGEGSTISVPWDKTRNGEIVLSYDISIPETEKKRLYEIHFYMPEDIDPRVSSLNTTVYTTEKFYDDGVYRFSLWYEKWSKESSKSTVDFTINIPEYCQDEDIPILADVVVWVVNMHGLKAQCEKMYFPVKKFSIKVR